MSATSASPSYFLSYSRADQDFALRFAKDLKERSVPIWVDQLDIRPSEHWYRSIEKAVRDCCGLLVLLSPRSAASDNVADEISFAIDHRKTVLPVMIERCTLPLRITRMQVIDATGDYARALDRCLEAMQERSAPSNQADAPRRNGVDPEVITSAKQELTAILGPIASVLVDREAARSTSADELRSRLATHIPHLSERQRFSRSGVEPSQSSQHATKAVPAISAEDLDFVRKHLTTYLGPVAEVVVRRESAGASSREELGQRLALRIPDPRERAQFLRQIGAPRT